VRQGDEDKSPLRAPEKMARAARARAEDEDAGWPTEDEDVGAATRAGAEDEDEDPPREPEKWARSDGRRTAGVVARIRRRFKGERREHTSICRVGTFSLGLGRLESQPEFWRAVKLLPTRLFCFLPLQQFIIYPLT
jgi:hypothetical protein